MQQEELLKSFLVDTLSNDFYLKEEVKGVNIVEKSPYIKETQNQFIQIIK